MRSDAIQQNSKELIVSAKRGEKNAFGKLYNLYFTPVYRYVYIRVKDKSEVEALTQDIFIKVYESLESFEVRNVSPLAFFFTVARNTIIDYWRKNRHQVSFGKEDILMQIPDIRENPEESFSKKEKVAFLYKALNKLTHEQREALLLKYFNYSPNKDIARFMGKSEEAVRQLQSRGVKSLRQILIDLNS